LSSEQSTYRLIYVSRNALDGPVAEVEAEVGRILDASRRNNARDGITGALLFSDTCFAQVLEGEYDVIHSVFERIQIDPRHADTVVLACGPAEREFGDWSMAYAGTVRSDRTAYGDLVRPGEAGAASDQVMGILRGAILRQ